MRFEEIFAKKRPLIPFLTAGVYGLEYTYHLATSLIKEGVSILEIGFPYSDPLADGEVIQKACRLALFEKITLKDVLGLIKRLKTKYPNVAIIFFSYLNPILSIGMENFLKEASKSFVSSTLIVDLPVEEAREVIELHKKFEIKTIFFASPTTSVERLKKIEEASSAFIYYISSAGVTGERNFFFKDLFIKLEKIKAQVKKPLVVGFGISNREQVRKLAPFVDGIVMGSAFMRLILESKNKEEAESKVRLLARECLL